MNKNDINFIQKPNILFVGPALGVHPGYIPSPVETLMPLLQERGFDCISTSSKLHRINRALDMLFTVIKTRKWSDVVSLQIYAHRSFIVEDVISWLVKRMKKRLIMVLHYGGFPEFIDKFPNWSKRVLSRADKIVAPSDFLKISVEKIGFSAEVIPHLIMIDKYDFSQRSYIKPKILWMRSFFHYYNPLLAVDTFKIIRDKYPDATLTMAGKDKGLKSKIKKYVFESGLTKSVRFPGFLSMEDKKREFPDHDIFINTNLIENFGISMIEAGAFGLPIVATNVGGVSFLFKDQENALLVSSDNAEAMALAVSRIIENHELASRLSIGGRKLAESCAPDVVLPLWEKLFRNLS